ncbi:MAG: polysaccharide biosynthesis C-terminal domain-containing protein [Saprospiraceae bacterium]
MSLIKKLAGETAIYGVSSILGRLLNYVIMAPFLTRIFGRAEYGVVTDMYATAAFLMVIFTYRIETAFFRFGKEKKDLNKVFASSSLLLLATTLFFVSLLFIFSEPIALQLGHPGKGNYFRIFAIILGADTLSAIPFARLRLINRPLVFAAIRMANIIVNILLVLFFLALCPYFEELGWSMSWIYNSEEQIKYVFLSNMVASLVMLLLLMPSYFNLKWTFDAKIIKKMLWYAGPLLIAGIAGVINQMVGIPIIKEYATPDAALNMEFVGIFGAAVKIPILMTLFTQAFNYAAEPFFFRNADRSDAKEVYGQVAQAFTIVAALAFLGIMLYLDLLQYILGKELRGGLGIVPIMLMAYLFLGWFYNFSIWYKLQDRTIVGGYIALGGTAITLILNFILVPQINIYGPAWAALACYGFMAYVTYRTGQRNYKINYPIKKMLLYVVVSLTGFFLSEWCQALFDNGILVKTIINTLILALCLSAYYLIDTSIFDSIIRAFSSVLKRKKETKEKE